MSSLTAVPSSPSPPPPQPWRGAVMVAVLALTAVVAFDHYVHHLAHTPGIDFYQYWAVPKARQASQTPLGSPYTGSERYAQVLEEYAAQSDDPRLHAVTSYRAEPAFESDPFVYVVGGWLPDDYTTALRVYQLLQLLALVVAMAILGRRADVPWMATVVLGLLMYLHYMPLLSELRVLNTNALQLAGLAVSIHLLSGRRGREGRWSAAVALCLTVVVALLKPLWLPLVALLALHLLATRSRAVAVRAFGSAVALTGVLVAWPALVFGPSVWSDWFRRVFGDDHGHLVYTVAEGNRSTSVLVSEVTGWGLPAATTLIAALLLGSAILAWWLDVGGDRGDLLEGSRRFLHRWIERPQILLGLGIAALLALTPLAWWHYYTLALVPFFALVTPRASTLHVALAVLSFLLASGRLGPVFAGFVDADAATIWAAALMWIPLWLGLLRPPPAAANSVTAE